MDTDDDDDDDYDNDCGKVQFCCIICRFTWSLGCAMLTVAFLATVCVMPVRKWMRTMMIKRLLDVRGLLSLSHQSWAPCDLHNGECIFVMITV